jgi:VIT1/CCC1 family predicted Fe2+/Mn2+ transporter
MNIKKTMDNEAGDGSITESSDTSNSLDQLNSRAEHLTGRQYLRDIILGVNDGLISTFLLVAGVVGSGLSTQDILLTAIAGSLAGSISMSAGEYIATKSQNEVLQGEIGLEKSHIENYRQEEMQEAAELLPMIGIRKNEEVFTKLISYYQNDPEALLRLMITLEFGVVEEEERSPITAAITSGTLFFLGSLPSVLPFVPRSQSSSRGLLLATVATMSALFLVGAIKAWATRGNCVTAAIENFLVAGVGGVLAFIVGTLFDNLLH